MYVSRRLFPFVPFFCFVTLAGCGGTAVAPGAAAVPEAYAQQSGSRTVDAVAVSAASEESTVPLAAPEAIVGAAVPNVSGTYVGTIEGRAQGSLIAKGPMTYTIAQSGGTVFGNVRFTVNKNGPVTRDFTGTVAATQLGAILHVTFTVPQGAGAAGAWLKIDGASLTGRGWEVPTQYEVYNQLLFWAKER